MNCKRQNEGNKNCYICDKNFCNPNVKCIDPNFKLLFMYQYKPPNTIEAKIFKNNFYELKILTNFMANKKISTT